MSMTTTTHGMTAGRMQPDATYLRRIVARHWGVGFVIAVGVMAPVFFLGAKISNLYRSEIVSAYDRRVAVDLGGFRSDGRIADFVESNFTLRLGSTEFLYEVAKRSNIAALGRRGLLNDILLNMGIASQESEDNRRLRIGEWMTRRVFPSVTPGTGILSLVVNGPDAMEAQILAQETMESFIQTELRSQSERAGIQLSFLRQALTSSQERMKALTRDPQYRDPSTREPSPTGEGEKGELRDKATRNDRSARQHEQEVADRVKLLESQVADMNDEFVRRRVALETEYQRLESKLQPNHPDVVAKRRELESFRQSPLQTSAIMELSALRRQLWGLRGDSLYPGVSGSAGMEGRLEASRIAALMDQIEELELERSSLERQIAEPASRTKIKVVKGASFEPKPVVDRQKKVVTGGLAAAFGLILLVTVGRELRSPVARDAWRLERAVNQPVVAQLAAISLGGEGRRITPMISDQLREHLASSESRWQQPTKALLAYRSFELAIRRKCHGRHIALFNASARDQTGEFMYNFMNILATDLNEPILLIDMNHVDPASPDRPRNTDFLDAIAGKVSMADVVMRKTLERAFDYARGPESYVGERSRMVHAEKLRALLQSSGELYRYIFIRGMAEQYYIENLAIGLAATDAFLLVDAGTTQLQEAARSASQLDGGKLRGLVMLGV